MGPIEFCRIGSHSSFVPLGNGNWDCKCHFAVYRFGSGFFFFLPF